jgi:hypothetical protein
MGIKHHLLRLARIGAHEQHPAPGKPDVSDLTIIITPLSRTTSRRRSWRVAFAPQPAQASVQTHHGAAQFLAAAGGVMFVRQAAGDVHMPPRGKM